MQFTTSLSIFKSSATECKLRNAIYDIEVPTRFIMCLRKEIRTIIFFKPQPSYTWDVHHGSVSEFWWKGSIFIISLWGRHIKLFHFINQTKNEKWADNKLNHFSYQSPSLINNTWLYICYCCTIFSVATHGHSPIFLDVLD